MFRISKRAGNLVSTVPKGFRRSMLSITVWHLKSVAVGIDDESETPIHVILKRFVQHSDSLARSHQGHGFRAEHAFTTFQKCFIKSPQFSHGPARTAARAATRQAFSAVPVCFRFGRATARIVEKRNASMKLCALLWFERKRG